MRLEIVALGAIVVVLGSVSAIPELISQEPDRGGLYFCGTSDEDNSKPDRSFGYYNEYFHFHDSIVGYVSASLQSLVVDAEIVDGTATRVTMVQEFATPAELPAGFSYSKAFYQIPVDESAAVVEFLAETKERTIVALVKDREEAQQEFEEAVENGNFAVLTEQSMRDLFHISVGNVPLNEIVRVTLSYVTVLETVGTNASRFFIPTAIFPRYESRDISRGIMAGGLNMINHGVQIDIKVTAAVAIDTIYSNTHNIFVEYENDKKLVANVNVTDKNPTDRDLAVVIESVANYQPRIISEYSAAHNTTAFMLSIVPDIKGTDDRKQEYVFILDRSGSMIQDKDGIFDPTKINQVRTAMSFILEQLPKNCTFNIVGFGDDFAPLFEEGSRKIDDKDSMLAAQNYLKSMEADFGGTEILAPIEHVLHQEPLSEYERNVFVLTDGHVSNTDEVIEYVRSKRAQGRVFALGIGAHVSSALVKGIARAGRGTAEFVDGDQENDVKDAVQRQLLVALNPAFDNVRVEWGSIADGEQVPYETPPLFAYKRFVAYFLVPGYAVNAVRDTVRLYSGDNIEYEVLQDSFVVRSGEDDILHKMASKSLIQELEDGAYNSDLSDEEVKEEIIRLGVEYQIASSETSFVAVDNGNWTDAYGIPQVDGDDVAGALFYTGFLDDYYDSGDNVLQLGDNQDAEDCEISMIPNIHMLSCHFAAVRDVFVVVITSVYKFVLEKIFDFP